MSREHILAVDLGTSGPKVALVSMEGRIADAEFRPVRLLLAPGGAAEQDPDEWWRAVCEASRAVVGRGAVAVEDIVAVACTAQWSGTVAVDVEGHHLMNAIIWMDTRGAPYIAQVAGGPIRFSGYGVHKALRWVHLTGGVPSTTGKDPLAHILYLKHQRPEIYRATHKFLEPKDWLNLKCTGRMAATYDSIALHWVTDNRDIHAIDYHPWLLRITGMDIEKLPRLMNATDLLGPLTAQAAEALGVAAGIPVTGGAPDLHSAAVGSGAVQDYRAHLYVGTSSWILCHVPKKGTDVLHNIGTVPSALPGRYLLANEQETAGACLNFLRDGIFFPDDALGSGPPPEDLYQRFDRMASQVPAGADNLIFTPWLYGERAPIDDHHVRGGFTNLTLRTTRAHMVRAVFEGVAMNSRWLLQAMEGFTRHRLSPIHMIGGGARSQVWAQIFADVMQREIRQMADPIHANIRGVVYLAAVALGRLRPRDIGELAPVTRTLAPDRAARAVHDELFAEFVNLYKRNKGIYARLNRARGQS